MLNGLRPMLQEQAGDADGGAGGIEDRKRYVSEQLEERFKPRQVRELLARYGNKAEVALEHLNDEHNDMVKRLMKRNAELEYDLKAAQKQVEAEQAARKQVEAERDEISNMLAERIAKERQAAIDDALRKRFKDDTLVRRHKAYLKLDGYELELDGERLMLVKDGRRHNFDTVVNDDWYARYDDARPSGDTPLPSNGPATPLAGGTPNGGASTFDPEAAAKAWGARVREARERIQIPGVTNG